MRSTVWPARLLVEMMLMGIVLLSVSSEPSSLGVASASTVPRHVEAQGAPAAVQWRWQNPLPHGNPLSDVVCPAQNSCYAVGNATIMASRDAGQTWTSTYAREDGQLLALACPDRLTCYALSYTGSIGTTIIGTTDGGKSWERLRVSPGTLLDHISCPSRAVCYAMGTYAPALLRTGDGGRTWTSISPRYGLAGISCPAVDVCYAPITTSLISSPAPGVAVTHDGARTWVLHAVGIRRGGAQLTNVRCVSVTTCFVLAYASGTDVPFIVKTGTGGASWMRQQFPKNTYFRGGSLVCPIVTVCYVSGDNGSVKGVLLATSDGGATWTRRKSLPVVAGGIACTAPSSCVAVGAGGAILKTSDAWVGWIDETYTATTPSVPTPDYALHAIACPATLICYGVGDFGLVVKTGDGGRTWRAVRTSLVKDHLTGPFTSLACPNRTVCYVGVSYPIASGMQGGDMVLSTRDGGRTWSRNPGRGVGVVACPSIRVCYAGGPKGAMRVTGDGGRTWRPVRTPLTSAYTVQRIVCPSTAICYAAAIGPYDAPMHDASNVGALLSTDDGGRTWRRKNTDPYPSVLACRTRTDCFAVIAGTNSSSLLTHDGGRTWRPWAVPQPNTWSGMTCIDQSTCYLVGGLGAIAVTRDAGGTWAHMDTPTLNPLDAIRCVGRDACYAVGGHGTILSTR